MQDDIHESVDTDAVSSFTPYFSPVDNWLLWPGQPVYFVGVVCELAVNGHIIATVHQETIVVLNPNETAVVAISNRLWDIKTEVELQLWHWYINQHVTR